MHDVTLCFLISQRDRGELQERGDYKNIISMYGRHENEEDNDEDEAGVLSTKISEIRK